MKKPDESTSGIPSSEAYRPDIDGLRGFGALLVLWFHFRETWNESPYKGADLTNSTFFAVSGFVITLSVFRARKKNPLPINLYNTSGFALVFFCRRLQRLVMTQFFVTYITLAIFLATVIPGPRLFSILTTAQYSVIGAANIYFGTRKEETFYIESEKNDLSLSRNPLMHTWYLGVEEQVYLLYPWIFAAAHIYTTRSYFFPYIIFGVIFLASLTCALKADRQTAYGFFLLQYRGWEVIVGVLTCHVLMYSKVFSSFETEDGFRNNVLYWPQLSFVVLISGSLWLFQYPEYSIMCTICALAGTAIFFISGHGYKWNSIYTNKKLDLRCEVPLLNYCYGLPLCAYVGRISYAMYLWHFPVAVLCADFKNEIQQLIGTNDALAFSLQFGLVMIISLFTHHMVENPFRWWRPSNQYLPALCILMLILGMEIFLDSIVIQVIQGAQSNIVRSEKDQLPPIFSTTILAFLVTAILVPVLLLMPDSAKIHCKKLTTLCAIPLMLLLYGIKLQTSQPLKTTSILTIEENTQNQSFESLVIKNKSTFWNWRGGTHSFASFGCACQHVGKARKPPDASNNTNLPFCYDSAHWYNQPQLAYKEVEPDCTNVFMNSSSWPTADEIWKKCREPGRIASHDGPTAFVFGSSVSAKFRVAVANAIGGEFSVLGYIQDNFNSPDLLLLLDTNTKNEIYFKRNMAKKKNYRYKKSKIIATNRYSFSICRTYW